MWFRLGLSRCEVERDKARSYETTGGPRPQKVRMNWRVGNSRLWAKAEKQSVETRSVDAGEARVADIAASMSARQSAWCTMRPSKRNGVVGLGGALCAAQKQSRAPDAVRANLTCAMPAMLCGPPSLMGMTCPPIEQTCHVGATNDRVASIATNRRTCEGNRSNHARKESIVLGRIYERSFDLTPRFLCGQNSAEARPSVCLAILRKNNSALF